MVQTRMMDTRQLRCEYRTVQELDRLIDHEVSLMRTSPGSLLHVTVGAAWLHCMHHEVLLNASAWHTSSFDA